MGLPLVDIGKEVLRELQCDGDEVKKGIQNLVVKLFGERLDQSLVLFKQLG